MAPYLALQRIAVLGIYRDRSRWSTLICVSLLGEFVDSLNIPLFIDLLRRVTRALAKRAMHSLKQLPTRQFFR